LYPNHIKSTIAEDETKQGIEKKGIEKRTDVGGRVKCAWFDISALVSKVAYSIDG